MSEQEPTHFSLWQIGRQQLAVTFDQGPLVSDAGLVAVRTLDRSLGILTELAARLPDPRAPQFVPHSTEPPLTPPAFPLLPRHPPSNPPHTPHSAPHAAPRPLVPARGRAAPPPRGPAGPAPHAAAFCLSPPPPRPA